MVAPANIHKPAGDALNPSGAIPPRPRQSPHETVIGGVQLLDRQWHEYLNGIKQPGPRGRPHWSLGCLCVDVPALNAEYAKSKRATSIDYASVLKWVVTDDANGQSHLPKPASYVSPLPLASKANGQFVRLPRLWEAAPDRNIDNYEAEEIAENILLQHGIPKAECDQQKRAVGALIIALRDVKQTRVTFLELAEYDEAHGDRDVYNDAIVNIFTRLNTAGRTLTREDITFAWLKIGWDPIATNNKSAKTCIDELVQQLSDLDLPLNVEDVISAISFIWSTSFNGGRLLTNSDLMRGDAIRPMAANVSESWQLVVDSVTRVSEIAKERGLRFREHYQSVNALSYLWAWDFMARQWAKSKALRETDKDAAEKRLEETLNKYMDRWLVCSQWAGVWAVASAANLNKYASGLADCAQKLTNIADVSGACDALADRLETNVRSNEQDAVDSLSKLHADDRRQVRTYYTALWLWNRLDERRWDGARIALRQHSRRRNSVEVDHIVACDLWDRKLNALPEIQQSIEGEHPAAGEDRQKLEIEEMKSSINEIGNWTPPKTSGQIGNGLIHLIVS